MSSLDNIMIETQNLNILLLCMMMMQSKITIIMNEWMNQVVKQRNLGIGTKIGGSDDKTEVGPA
jgi:hypothetical protein